MPDLFKGGTRPKTMIIDSHPTTLGPVTVKDIYLGGTWVWTPDEDNIIGQYTTPGTHYYTLPPYAAELDCVVYGGGGGGTVGHGGNGTDGKGGASGSYNVKTLTGVKGGTLKVVVGDGGAGGNPGGGDGGESSVAIGFLSVRAAGGLGGSMPTKYTSVYPEDPIHYGVAHPIETNDLADGGRGGNGGFFNTFTFGDPGKPGYAWFRVRKVKPYL